MFIFHSLLYKLVSNDIIIFTLLFLYNTLDLLKGIYVK